MSSSSRTPRSRPSHRTTASVAGICRGASGRRAARHDRHVICDPGEWLLRSHPLRRAYDLGDPMIPELIRTWVTGWAASRRTPPPAETPWGLALDIGNPRQVARHVLPEPDELAVRAIADSVT